MTTTADLISECRQYFLGGIREQKNKLASGGTTASTTDTTLTFTYPMAGIQAGAVLSVGLERMYVWATTDTTATVERAWDGTTIATHTAGDIVTVNARADDFAILRALNNDLAALSAPSAGLFRVRSVDLTYVGGTYGYDLTGVTNIIGTPLLYAEVGTAGMWEPIKTTDYLYNASADASDFASGHSIMFYDDAAYSGRTVRVVYKAPFTALSTLADNVQNVSFLPATANDIPPMGAALQLASSRPMQRTDLNAQGSTRRMEEVDTQSTLNAPAGLRNRYEKRIEQEAARLAADWPVLI